MKANHFAILAALLVVAGVYFMTRPSRNIRNNNPLNIRESAQWTGEKAIDLDKAFEEFKTPEYGFRAAYIILLQYLERGDNTIERIISKWAPTVDNNHTDIYIEFVAESLNVSEFQELSPKELPELMLAMSVFEGGRDHFKMPQVIGGIELANKESFVIARLERLGYGVYV